ncbi:MAG TPA: branched-chain amino acid ABC transporter permease [Actinophytocola sp.]|jgi:branched-chain amino acid transport system permease protein|uniref:branched-chain amino acid ABC transporter permease n=1 Tax=Actinophytocola sp. TaxID=1872138 RepID=UPI002F95AF21
MTLVNAVVQGVLLGGMYALFATGLSLMFGVMRIVNLAHGDFAVFGAFFALVLVDSASLSPLVTLLIVVPGMAAFGYLLQRGLLQRAVVASPLPALLVTFGLSIVVQNLLLELFSADQRRLQIGSFETGSFQLTYDLAIGYFPAVVFAIAVALLVGLSLFLRRTQLGRLMRATSDDQETARLMGVDNRNMYALAAAIAFATVGLAGVLNGVQTNFSPASGPTLLIFAFEAVIIGGLGSLWGTLLGGIVLGVAQNVGAWIEPAQQVLAGHLVFLLVLALRPRGLLAKGAPA